MQRRSSPKNGNGRTFLQRVPAPVRSIVPILISFSCIAILLEFFLFGSLSRSFAASYESEHRNAIERLVKVARSAIEPTLEELRRGELTRGEAMVRVRSIVRRMTYEDRYGPNYLFMSTYDGTMLVQPYDPVREGTNQWDLKDEKGKYIIRALVAAARERPEGAFVTYWFYPPNKERQEEKVSYVIGIPELNAYIGTGIYSHALTEENERFIARATLGSILLMTLTVALAAVSSLYILGANRRLGEELSRLSAAESALQYSERNLRTLFDTFNDAVIVHDGAGGILEVNEGAARLYGLPRERFVGLSILDLTYGENAQERFRETLASFVERGTLRFDWQARRPLDGTCFDVEVYLTSGSWYGQPAVIAVARDVTERRKTEASLIQRTAELERFERLTVGRELRMIELKRMITELEGRIARSAPEGAAAKEADDV